MVFIGGKTALETGTSVNATRLQWDPVWARLGAQACWIFNSKRS